MDHSGNAAADNRVAGSMVDGRPVDGTQEAGSPEDDVPEAVRLAGANRADAQHWVAESLAGAIPEGVPLADVIQEDARLQDVFRPQDVFRQMAGRG
ncbi:hypothetical protein A9Q94_18940 [Rhodobacterales bacterium 56_14_T64]|nr:hypothetical protein A9Q94_18940 [Rhodobacterales bacterium 56_14_T64]